LVVSGSVFSPVLKIYFPDQPFGEDYHIKKRPEYPVVGELPITRPFNQDNTQDDDSEDVNSMHHQNGCRNEPGFVFPWTRKEQKDNSNLEKLFQSGAGVVYHQGGLRQKSFLLPILQTKYWRFLI